MKYLYSFIVLFLIFIFFQMVVSAESDEDLIVMFEYKESTGKMIYFDVSEHNKLCVSYDNDKVYEYDPNGKFLRIIEYNSSGNIYAYYKNDDLIINDIRKKIHFVVDETGLCVEKFEANNADSGYYISEECNKNIQFKKNNYEYQFIHSNWFSRVFKKEKTQIIVKFEDETIVKIEEDNGIYNDLIPLITIVIFLIVIFFLKRYNRNLSQNIIKN